MDLKRRQFLTSSLAGLGGAFSSNAVVSQVLAKSEEERQNSSAPFSTDPLARVKLTPNIETSRIGMGTGMSGYNHSAQLTRMDRTKAENLIRHCYDSGVRFFDCADLYGTHEIISSTLKDKPRDSYTISSKYWPHPGGIEGNPENESATDAVKRFLHELHTDYLDLIQIHCIMKPNWEEDCKRIMDELEECKEKGLVRGHGISCHAVGAVASGAECPWVDAMHIRLNATGARMDGTFEENVEAARKAKNNGKGIICMKLIGEGTIRELEERQRSIDAVVRSQAVDVYIVGFEENWQVDELITNIGNSLNSMAEEQKA